MDNDPQSVFARCDGAPVTCDSVGPSPPDLRHALILHLVFCDVFDMRGGKIRRLVSYLMETAASGHP